MVELSTKQVLVSRNIN